MSLPSGTPADPSGRVAILHPPGVMGLRKNPFGKDVANLQLWQALARHGGYAQLDVLTLRPTEPEPLRRELLGDGPGATKIACDLYPLSPAPVEAGTLLRGQPDLYDLAWVRRRRSGDRAYSLIGMIHTLAPPAIRQMIAMTQTAPLHPWDALICTSPSVRAGVQALFAGWGQHLAERTGGAPPPHPALPVIPLGVHGADFAALADRPDARSRLRQRLGLAEADVLLLWVGRLSYYEKAFPQPMLKAAQLAQAATGAKVAFAFAGWFPEPGERALYEAAVKAHAPDVAVHLLDGNDRELLGELWAGADVFVSLVDNIQETFGITPLEAMAAGLPVVASDWDGYRSTVADGETGFLIPTLAGPAGGGVGAALIERHVLELATYQAYVGAVAQHTAVHIGRAAGALAELIRNPDLRRRMGQAGRARVAQVFDWPVVARQIRALTDELAQVRAAAADPARHNPADPVKSDPFAAFAPFASHALTLDTVLAAAPGASPAQVAAVQDLDAAFPGIRAAPALCAQALELLIARGPTPARDILLAFPQGQRRGLELGLAWMAKYGFIDWLT